MRHGLQDYSGNHQRQCRECEWRSPQSCMLKSGHSLVSKTHDKEADETEDHSVSMRQHPRVVDGAETLLYSDREEIDRAPYAAKSQDGGDSGQKERSINSVGNRR